MYTPMRFSFYSTLFSKHELYPQKGLFGTDITHIYFEDFTYKMNESNYMLRSVVILYCFLGKICQAINKINYI